MTHTLRPATAEDRNEIAEIWHAGASLPGVGPAALPSQEALRARLEDEFAAGWAVTLAVRGGRTLGFVAIRRGDGVLAELFVRPDTVGLGVGRALLDHAKLAMPGGFTLYTRSANGRARRFYERNGLCETGEGLHPRSGDPVTYYAWIGRADAKA